LEPGVRGTEGVYLKLRVGELRGARGTGPRRRCPRIAEDNVESRFGTLTRDATKSTKEANVRFPPLFTVVLVAVLAALAAAPVPAAPTNPVPPSYLDYSGRDDLLSGGVKMIPIETSKGPFRVWTKRIGNNPKMKVLLLHGGPGFSHEYMEAFDGCFPGAGIEYYYYDQLGSFYSDQPDEPDLWELPRFVEEVESVRKALGLGPDNFYLYGHSWGGLLATEYALKYQENLKGLIISNMVASVPRYNEYATRVIFPRMNPDVLAEIKKLEAAGDITNPRYMELLIPHHYEKHVLRIPAAEWPDPVQRAFKHMNPKVYVPMQGPSELGASGKLAAWDRMADLGKIAVPALMIGAKYDTMDPELMKKMAGLVKRGRYLYCENGSHLAMYDDQKAYFDGLIRFIRDVDGGKL